MRPLQWDDVINVAVRFIERVILKVFRIMELTKEQAKENLSKLVAKFEKELSSGKIKDYNEEAAKISFIQPLLKDVLGWDVNNHDEVSPEEKISRDRVDYGLKVEGKIRIFVEAKPPKVDLNKFIEQAVRYGYNKKSVPFVLLTDFEGIKLFDVTVKPEKRNPLAGLRKDLSWNQYVKEFDQLWVLSKESVIQGELDKLLIERPPNRITVDKAILNDLKIWRESLAKDIFKNNHHLFQSGNREKDADYLKEITQRIIDRIIFIRFCEDRKLVSRPQLKEIFEGRTDTVGTRTMLFLKEEFTFYNSNFNSDLFRFQDWENNLSIDFKVMRSIVLDTYEPYLFDVIPIEVLGNIYEQYLGYTIRLTEHQAKYELKPEVRKAGGVYYTPEYIVDYIVKNTVGKLLQELPHKKIKKLRILDPACGSGSFLIRAYEEMLNYYLNQKKMDSESKRKVKREVEFKYNETESRLTVQEKSEILRNHIFGVDIDEQAVEVTKLSLMLKMLDKETGIIQGKAILPMLDENIKCGNSLISGDTLELKKYFGDDYYKVKPFNLDEEFKTIMKEEGGFDVVIGNPPYGAELSDNERLYLESNFKLHSTDTACLFMGLAIKILNSKGINGFIVPKPFVYSSNWKMIREKLCNGLIEIVDCKKVWKEVKLEQVIYFFQNDTKSNSYHSSIREGQEIKYLGDIDKITFKEFGFYLNGISAKELFVGEKIRNSGAFLKDFIINQRGAIYQKYVIKEISDFKVLGGKQIERYFISYNIKGYINKKLVTDEKAFIKDNSILVQNIVAHIEYPIDHIKIIASLPVDLNISKYIIVDTINQLQNNSNLSSKFLLSIINSKLISWYVYRFLYGKAIRTMHFDNSITDRIPFPKINLKNKNDKQLHDNLVSLVEVMLDLNKKVQVAKGNEKERIQKQIDKTDREIDEIVYKLYGITDEERKIIEGQ